MDGGVPTVGADHQLVLGGAVLGPEFLVQRLGDLVSSGRDRGAGVAHLEVLQQGIEDLGGLHAHASLSLSRSASGRKRSISREVKVISSLFLRPSLALAKALAVVRGASE